MIIFLSIVGGLLLLVVILLLYLNRVACFKAVPGSAGLLGCFGIAHVNTVPGDVPVGVETGVLDFVTRPLPHGLPVVLEGDR